jgi:hypothetical protein
MTPSGCQFELPLFFRRSAASRNYFDTRPLIAFARAPWVMRPAVRRQPRAHSRFEQFSITGSHGRDRLTNSRSHHAGRPKVFEVSKRSLHSDLPHFDRIEAGIHPQAPQRLHLAVIQIAPALQTMILTLVIAMPPSSMKTRFVAPRFSGLRIAARSLCV